MALGLPYEDDSDTSTESDSDHARSRSRTRVIDGSDIGLHHPLESRVAAAFTAFRQRLDCGAKVHGSQACGLSAATSDLDLLASITLHELKFKLRSKGTGFTLVEHVTVARVPRLLLRHQCTGLEIDIIEADRDPCALEKDALVRSWLNLAVEIQDFARAAVAWARKHREELPRDEGFPNSFLFLITALCYLRHQVGVVGPPEFNSENVLGKIPAALPTLPPANVLFDGWLSFLAESATAGVPCVLDVQRSSDVSHVQKLPAKRCWAVVEPVSGCTACSLTAEQAKRLAAAARASASCCSVEVADPPLEQCILPSRGENDCA